MAKWLNKWYMVNDKMVNDLVMEKKQYIIPRTEVTTISSALMITGPASVLPGPGAPERDPNVF